MIERSLQHSKSVENGNPSHRFSNLSAVICTNRYGRLDRRSGQLDSDEREQQPAHRLAQQQAEQLALGAAPPQQQNRPVPFVEYVVSRRFTPLFINVPPLLYAGQSFPTPMEEPRKVLKAKYVGSLQVSRPSGMDVLNDAIDQMVNQVPADQWRDVNVAVAPSVVTITDAEVRFIARSIFEPPWRTGTLIKLLSAAGRGEAHRRVSRTLLVVFGHRQASGELRIHRAHGERRVHRSRSLLPAVVWRHLQDDRGRLQGEYHARHRVLRTSQLAPFSTWQQLRYQKCLDAHGALRGRIPAASSGAQTPTGRSLEAISATLKSVFGSISLGAKRVTKSTSSDS